MLKVADNDGRLVGGALELHYSVGGCCLQERQADVLCIDLRPF